MLPIQNQNELSARQKAVLESLLIQYLQSGEAVASGRLAEQNRLSSATIRNVLSGLEEEGWLYQPHTSAGRLPTRLALQYYACHMAAPAPLPESAEELLERELDAAENYRQRLSAACRFLAEFSRQAAVAALSPAHGEGVREIRFLRLHDRRVLSVLVSTLDEVREQVATLPEDYTQDELDAAGRYLMRHFTGWSLEKIRQELAQRVREDRAAYDQLLKRVLVLVHCGLAAAQGQEEVYLEGASRLLKLLEGHPHLTEMLEALTRKEKLLELVQALLAEGDTGERTGVRVQVGLERQHWPELALLWAPYQMPDHRLGAVAVLGSARMEYGRVLGALARVGEMLAGEPGLPPQLIIEE